MLARGSSTEVEHSPHHPKVEGLNPPATVGTGISNRDLIKIIVYLFHGNKLVRFHLTKMLVSWGLYHQTYYSRNLRFP
jgi:hypothetical protein